MKNLFNWTILSEKKEELKHIIGCEIVDIVKVSYESFQDYLLYLDDICENRYRDIFSFFRYHYGSIVFSFNNGMEYSFCIADDLNSIIMSCERDINGNCSKNYYLDDDSVIEMISINYFKEFTISCNFLNQPINAINILTKKDLSSKLECVPSEMGLELILQNGEKIYLHHNLGIENFYFIDFDKNNLISNARIICEI